jgi:hypothetical protein
LKAILERRRMESSPLRSKQRLAVTVAALLFGPLFMGGPLVGGLALLWFAPPATGIPGGLLLILASGFIAYHMLQNFHWVELDGNIVRGRKFWTRRLVEQRVEDITGILPLQALAKHEINVLIDGISGAANRGYEIRFRGGPRIALVRWDMADVDGFMLVLRVRWREAMPDELP